MLRLFSASSSPSSYYHHHRRRHFHKSTMSIVNAATPQPAAACHRSFPSPLSTATAAPISAAVRRIGRGIGRSGAIRIQGNNANIHHTTMHDRDDAESHPLPPVAETPSLFQTLSSDQKDQISLYVRTLLHWNKRMNLTAVREEGDAMRRHVEDSLAMLPPIRRCYRKQLQEKKSSCSQSVDHLRVIDIGTGAGLPGLILAVACPGWRVTLLESMQKRCRFLENAIDLMGISNVHILCSRAESAGHKLEFREAFDLAVARAVAEMRVLVEYSLPFVRVGGLFVAAKGHDPQEEVKYAENAIRLMGSSILDSCTVDSRSPHGQRTAIICRKDCLTPKVYPRPPGVPSKYPL